MSEQNTQKWPTEPWAGAMSFFLAKPWRVFLACMLFSAFSLAAALVAQYGFDMHPCILCLYQRAPFVVIFMLGLIGLRVGSEAQRSTMIIMVMIAVTFAIGAGIAVYHTGVEQLWWVNAVACTPVNDEATTVEQLRAQIFGQPFVPCDVIPWSLFGISMAGYNAIISTCAAIISSIIAFIWYRSSSSPAKKEDIHTVE